ncbi:PQQ-binding-like beta-propeller repeat protein [Thalassobacillus sp. CUG 92003]|uniref:outer membrane protein assembly factor BamB family protein n=1 Tax=Thalassobacillus sp. CUG 92003 TaxID=2736641 RepID=UPI0015E79313|nr:PQQ-binding-like beta-propeller repeat protein [Thalassobacillus sp. CUG 92003]
MGKKLTYTFFTFISICLIFPALTKAQFGPSDWTEYRLYDTNNPVFDSDDDIPPLPAQKFKTNDEIRSTPVVVGNRIFIGNHNTGDMFAYDILTGEKLWTNQAPNWIHSEMIYKNGTLFVGFGNRFFQENGIRGTEESGIMAVDAESGDELWTYETEGEVMPTPAYYDGSIYAATGDQSVYQLDPGTGDLIDQIELGSIFSMSSPNIYQDHLFIGGGAPSPYTFYSVDLRTNETRWETKIPDATAGLDDVPPAISNDTVVTTVLETPDSLALKDIYHSSGAMQAYKEITKSLFGLERSSHPEHFIYALDTETGEIKWRESLGVGPLVKNNKSGAPMIYDGKVFVGSPITQQFYAYDLDTGERLWTEENTVNKAPPVAKDNAVYFTNAEGFVHAYDTETGEEVGRKELGGTLAPSGPLIMNDTFIVGSQDSNVYALPLSDILSANDSYQTEPTSKDSQTGFVFWIYIFPLILVGALIFAVVVSFKKWALRR